MSSKAWIQRMEEALSADVALFERAWEEAPKAMPKKLANAALFRACIEINPRWVAMALDRGGEPRGEILPRMARHVDATHDARAWTECVEILMAHGVKLDAEDDWGGASLHHALRDASRSAPWAAMALLDLGASATLKTDHGESPLDLALSSGNVGVAKRLLDQGEKPTPPWTALTLAITSNTAAMVAFALGGGEDPAQRARNPMHGAKKGSTVGLISFARSHIPKSQTSERHSESAELIGMLRSALEAKNLAKSVKMPRKKTRKTRSI